MSLFPLAALVKEPRFIPPHRLAVRRRYKWLPSENMRGWERRRARKKGYRCREKENVCGPPSRRWMEALRKIAREIPLGSDPPLFLPFFFLSVPSAFSLPPVNSNTPRIRVLRFKWRPASAFSSPSPSCFGKRMTRIGNIVVWSAAIFAVRICRLVNYLEVIVSVRCFVIDFFSSPEGSYPLTIVLAVSLMSLFWLLWNRNFVIFSRNFSYTRITIRFAWIAH